jgi:hypothetical protein
LGFVTIFATGAGIMQVGGKYFARENFFTKKVLPRAPSQKTLYEFMGGMRFKGC